MRAGAEPERGPSTTFGGRSRVPSSRMGARERPLSSGEVIPEDSASNAPSRRTLSTSHKNNAFSAKIQMERHVGRVQQTTREKLQVRTRSPVKPSQSARRGSGDVEAVDQLSSRQATKSSPRQAGAPDMHKACKLQLPVWVTRKLGVIAVIAWKPQASLMSHTHQHLSLLVSPILKPR